MDEYRILYTLNFEHSYISSSICKAIDVQVNQASLLLMKRRGLLFRQTKANEWSLFCKKTDLGKFSESDIILLNLYISDPAFLLYTQWDGFNLTKMYGLALPAKERETNATILIKETGKKQGIGYGFCLAELHLSELVSSTGEDILQFKAKAANWEFLFISRSNQLPDEKNLKIKEDTNKLIFGDFDCFDFLGTKALRVKSTAQTPMCECYGYILKLIEEKSGGATITILSELPYPMPGVYQSNEMDTLRQICYIK